MYFPSPANIRLTGLFAFIYLLFQLTVGIFTECDMLKIKPLCSQRLRHRRHGRLLLLHFPYPGLHQLFRHQRLLRRPAAHTALRTVSERLSSVFPELLSGQLPVHLSSLPDCILQ